MLHGFRLTSWGWQVAVWGGGGSWWELLALVLGSWGFLGLLASVGLMAMRLYKVYDIVMASQGFVVIQTISVTVDLQSC